MARPRPAIFSDMGGGLNVRKSPLELDPNESPYLLNVQLNGGQGAIKTRQRDSAGVTNVGTGTSGTRFISIAPIYTDSNRFWMQTADGWIILFDRSSGEVAGSSLGAGGTTMLSYAIGPESGGQGPLYMVNQAAVARYATSAGAHNPWTASAGTLPSEAKLLLYSNNRMWAANMGAYGALTDPESSLVWSELGDPRNWPAANVVSFDPHDGDQIRAIVPLGQNLLVFKQRKAWLIYDLDTGANRRIGVEVGQLVSAERTVVETPHGVVFIDPDRGVCVTDGYKVDFIGEAIQPQLRENQVDGLLVNATAVYHLDKYLLCTNNNDNTTSYQALYEYDFSTKTWWQHATLAKNIAYYPSYAFGEGRVLAARAPASNRPQWMWVLDNLQSEVSATAITLNSCLWTSRYHDFGDPQMRKRLRHINIYGEGGSVTTNLFRDFEATPLKTWSGGAFTGGADGPGRLELPTPGVGRLFQLQTLLADVGTDLELHNYEMYAQARAR